MSTVLPRINTEKFTDALAVERQKLLVEAGNLLCYHPGQKASLLNQLLALGIVPFKTEAVEAYMQSKRKVGMWSGTKIFIWWVAISVAALVVAIYGDTHLVSDTHPTLFGVFSIVLSVGLGVNVIVMMATARDRVGHGSRKSRDWNMYGFSNCERVIPDHVLNTALTIKRNINAADMSIVALVEGLQHNPKPVPVPDPFLKVSMGRESYYVEQWNEKDFPHLDE